MLCIKTISSLRGSGGKCDLLLSLVYCRNTGLYIGQVDVCVCMCTLSDLIRLYLWQSLTPLRVWQQLSFLVLSAFIFSQSPPPLSLPSQCSLSVCSFYSSLHWSATSLLSLQFITVTIVHSKVQH